MVKHPADFALDFFEIVKGVPESPNDYTNVEDFSEVDPAYGEYSLQFHVGNLPKLEEYCKQLGDNSGTVTKIFKVNPTGLLKISLGNTGKSYVSHLMERFGSFGEILKKFGLPDTTQKESPVEEESLVQRIENVTLTQEEIAQLTTRTSDDSSREEEEGLHEGRDTQERQEEPYHEPSGFSLSSNGESSDVVKNNESSDSSTLNMEFDEEDEEEEDIGLGDPISESGNSNQSSGENGNQVSEFPVSLSGNQGTGSAVLTFDQELIDIFKKPESASRGNENEESQDLVERVYRENSQEEGNHGAKEDTSQPVASFGEMVSGEREIAATSGLTQYQAEFVASSAKEIVHESFEATEAQQPAVTQPVHSSVQEFSVSSEVSNKQESEGSMTQQLATTTSQTEENQKLIPASEVEKMAEMVTAMHSLLENSSNGQVSPMDKIVALVYGQRLQTLAQVKPISDGALDNAIELFDSTDRTDIYKILRRSIKSLWRNGDKEIVTKLIDEMIFQMDLEAETNE